MGYKGSNSLTKFYVTDFLSFNILVSVLNGKKVWKSSSAYAFPVKDLLFDLTPYTSKRNRRRDINILNFIFIVNINVDKNNSISSFHYGCSRCDSICYGPNEKGLQM